MGERRTELRPLSTLQANPDNAKTHDLVGIGQSMFRFGMVELIVLDERTGFIVSGHGRTDSLRATKDRGEDPPDEDIRVAEEDGDWWVPVVLGWASADDTEAAAATVAVNAWVERGGWNIDLLLSELSHLDALDRGLEGVGFFRDDIDDLIARSQENQTTDDTNEGWGDPDRQVRSIQLDYPLDDYRWITDAAARARLAYNVGSTAELFTALLREDANA